MLDEIYVRANNCIDKHGLMVFFLLLFITSAEMLQNFLITLLDGMRASNNDHIEDNKS
jgi:hypothetical protein